MSAAIAVAIDSTFSGGTNTPSNPSRMMWRGPLAQSDLLSWSRDTVSYDTPSIQRKTRALAASLGDAKLLEAIGTASLANATVRLAMLLE